MRNVLKHLEEIFGCLFLVAFVGLTVLNVVLRYFFKFILSWAEEAILITFVWGVFLGVITAFRADRHVAIDVFVNMLPKKVQRIIGYGVDILVLALAVYMTYLGIVLCMNVGVKSTIVLMLNYVYIDVVVIISFGMISVFSIIKLIRRITGKYEYVDSVTRVINEVSNLQ